MHIYHIVLPEAWEAFEGDLYEAASLASEGFIHCSYEHQIDAVLGRYYSGEARVLILTLDAEQLASSLVEEPSTGGEIYPHIYGPINRDAIVGSTVKKM